MRILFNDYQPDVAPEVLGPQGMTDMENALKDPAGYRSLGLLTQMTAPSNALSNVCYGAGIGISAAGASIVNYAADASKLYAVSWNGTTWVDLSSTWGGGHTNHQVQFVQFDDYIIAIAGDHITPWDRQISQGVVVGSGFNIISADAPCACCGATVGEHLVLGNFYDQAALIAAAANYANGIWWSAIGNHTSWPTPATSAAVAAQSDYRLLRSQGGKVRSIIGRGNTGYVFQDRAITRMDQVGGVVIFEFDNVSENVGCFAQHTAVDTPVGIMFLSHAGWQLLGDVGRPVAIGGNTFNRHFLEGWKTYQWSEAQTRATSLVADMETHSVYYLYRRAAGVEVDTVLVWDWEADAFSVLDTATTVTRLAALHVDDGAIPEIGAFNASHRYSRWTGADLTATFVSGDIEANPGGRATAMSAKPLVQGSSPTITLEVSARDDLDDAVSYGTAKSPNSWGRFDCSEDGRYHRFRLKVTGTFDTVTGVDVDFVPSGSV